MGRAVLEHMRDTPYTHTMKFLHRLLARGEYWRGTQRVVFPLSCMLVLLAAPTAQAAGVLQDLLSGLAAGTAASPPSAPAPKASGPAALPMMTTKTPLSAGTIPLPPMDMTPMWSRQTTPAPQAGQASPLIAAAQASPTVSDTLPLPATQTTPSLPTSQATPAAQPAQTAPSPQAGQAGQTPTPSKPKATASAKAAAKAKGKAKNTPAVAAPAAPVPSVAAPASPPEVLSGPQAEAAAAYAAGDYAKAHALWQNLADKADPRAMYNLGVLYDKGQGVSEDPTLAAFWFLKSAEAGHAAGMSNLGRLLEQGRGLSRNPTQAASWFRKAADKGLAEAQYNLAVLYERGLGVEKSDREAAAWYSRAAAQSQTEAQGRLGQMYREGRGVSKNATRAVLLLYGASMDGNGEAIRALEEMAVDPEIKGKAAPSRLNPAVLFGLPLEHTTRDAVRQTMAAAKVPAVREDAAFICDVYNVRAAIPGATEMAACYGPGVPQPLGFVKIDYPSPDKQHTEKVTAMLTTMLVDRFGPPSATEAHDAALWNLGKVIVAVQHSPATKETGLMYMVPRVYHLTRDMKN